MKKLFFAMIITSLSVSSCDKVVSSPSNDSSSSFGDDNSRKGGGSGSGGGTNISASSVPAAVMSSFKSQFPAATNTEWKKLDNGNYKAQFYVNGVKWEVVYSPAGVQLKLERA